ncbi:MAG: hypothetical protein AAFQ22_00515 [Pseudomonadota bacterium]
MKYPPEHFELQETLCPVITYLGLCRYDERYPPSVVRKLGYIQGLLFSVVDDDLLGLIDATPEQRVRHAEGVVAQRERQA